ncbi:hypothetical protein EEY24_00600 (plasmid) [Shewanella algae]|nr:hypothetical protein EEY24_00600 [Shewanella algae]
MLIMVCPLTRSGVTEGKKPASAGFFSRPLFLSKRNLDMGMIFMLLNNYCRERRGICRGKQLVYRAAGGAVNIKVYRA